MADEESLSAFLRALWSEPIDEPPADETWPEMVRRIKGGGNQRICSEAYRWFLECLPPHYHGGDFFAFCEGAEPLRLFTRREGAFVCRQLDRAQTVTFCELAGIDLPD